MRTAFAGIALALAACGSPGPSFTAEDEAAVRALEEAYRTAWLANDSAAVMATLEPDAVLMPAGMEPLAGDAAIRSYWWPDDGSRTTITAYDITVDEVEGAGDLAYLRGRGALEFTYVDPAGDASELTSRAVHLSVARRGADGAWRIARRAWSATEDPEEPRRALQAAPEDRDRAGAWVEDIETPQYVAVLVEEVDESVRWYRTAFGLRELGGSEAEDGTWRIVNLGNDRLFVEIIRDDRAAAVERARGFFKVGFQVPEVERVADRVAEATGERPRVLSFRRFGVRIIQLRDPDGNIIQLSSPLDP